MRHYTKGHPVLISQLERQCARNEIQLKADSSHFLCVLSISLFLFICMFCAHFVSFCATVV